MNFRRHMMLKAKRMIHKQRMNNLEWQLNELVRLAHEDTRKPHEKVVDTTIDRAPEFYGSLASVISLVPQEDCKKGLEHLHKREYREAHAYFLIAARSGYAEGQYRLGSLYLYGRGVNVDYNLAECWFWEAAKGGFVPQALDALRIVERYREKNK